MRLTTKRILIAFSLFLNIGFVAAAAHHAIFFDPMERGRRVAEEGLEKLKIPESKRTVLEGLQEEFHQSLKDYFTQRRSIMNRRLDALTGLDAPDPTVLTELKGEQMDLLSTRIDSATDMLLRMREAIGPERTREFIDNIRSRHGRKRP